MMPSSVIKHKQKIAGMTAQEKVTYFNGPDMNKERVQGMEKRHCVKPGTYTQYLDPFEPQNLNTVEALADLKADTAFDYIPVGSALAKYSSLLEVLTYNRDGIDVRQMQHVLNEAHSAMMRKLVRAELHIEETGTTPRLPR